MPVAHPMNNGDHVPPYRFTLADAEFQSDIRRPARKMVQYSLYVVYTTTSAKVNTTPDLELAASDQSWYWTDAWQAAEREAEADLLNGNYQDFDSIHDFFADLLADE